MPRADDCFARRLGTAAVLDPGAALGERAEIAQFGQMRHLARNRLQHHIGAVEDVEVDAGSFTATQPDKASFS